MFAVPEGGGRSRDMDVTKLIKGRGCLKISAYVHYGMLTVHVMQAKHLRSGVANRCNTCVTVSLEPDVERQTECKTRVVEDSNQPLIDEKFSYELLEDDFRKRLQICVWNTTPNHPATELLGCMSFGLRHIMTKRTEVNGWYFLLSEELGRRKHLKAAISRNHGTQALHTSGTSSTLDNLNNMSMASSASFCSEVSRAGKASRMADRSYMMNNTSSYMNPNTSYMNPNTSYMNPNTSYMTNNSSCLNTTSLNTTSNTSFMTDNNVSFANPNNTSFMASNRRNTMRVNTSFTSCDNTTYMDRSIRSSRRDRREGPPVVRVPPVVRPSEGEFEFAVPNRPADVSYMERKKEVSFCLPSDASDTEKSTLRRMKPKSRSKLDDLENVWMDTMTVVLKRSSGNIGFTLTGENPAQVCSIQKGSVAEKSGLRENDYIMSINGLCVSNGTTQTVATVIRHCKTSKLIIEVQRPQPLIRKAPRNTFSPPRSKAAGTSSSSLDITMPSHGLKRKAAHSSSSSIGSLSKRTGQKLRALMNRSSSFLKIR